MLHTLALRAKHWQVFLCLLAFPAVSWFVKDEALDSGLKYLGTFLMVAWLVLQVMALFHLRPSQEGYNASRFLVNAFIVLLAWAYSSITEDPNFHVATTSWRASGFGTFILLYVFFAFLHIHWFPASLLIATEQGRRPDISQVIGGFLLCFFWPVGVWFIQPRLNTLWEEKQWEQQALRKLGTGEQPDASVFTPEMYE